MPNRFAALVVEDLEPEIPVETHGKKKAPKPQEQKKDTAPAPAAAPATSGNRAPKREFDRHSGTGRGPAPQKNGAGRHHWGDKTNPVTELENETQALSPVENGAAAEEVKPEEPKVPTFTLEEFKKNQKAMEGEAFAAKQERAVAAINAERIVRVEEDFFVGDKKKKNKKKKQAKAVEATDILKFNVVDEIKERPDRPVRSDRPERSGPRGPRPTGDRPPRGPRPAGDRPAGDRPAGDRPERSGPRGPRPAGDRPPRGPRPAGDRPPRRDRPAGEKKDDDGFQVMGKPERNNRAPRGEGRGAPRKSDRPARPQEPKAAPAAN